MDTYKTAKKFIFDAIIEIIIFGICILFFQHVYSERDEFLDFVHALFIKPFKIIMVILCFSSIFLNYKRGIDDINYIQGFVLGFIMFIRDESIILTIFATCFVVYYLVPNGNYLDPLMLWVNRMMNRGFIFTILTMIIYVIIFNNKYAHYHSKIPPFVDIIFADIYANLMRLISLYSAIRCCKYICIFGINFYIWFIINGIRYIIFREKN
uniref:Uncharacterized protein n=1 Tax=Borely moumouvirus TaxID=2712067 RepID=A0A6G6AB46_9VIRU